MVARRVYVIWTHPLFHESVRLLLDHPDVEAVGATSNYQAAGAEIMRLRPDIIVVEEQNGNIPTEIIEILKACTWQVRLFSTNLDDNLLNVYSHEQREVGRAEDLLFLVQQE